MRLTEGNTEPLELIMFMGSNGNKHNYNADSPVSASLL